MIAAVFVLSAIVIVLFVVVALIDLAANPDREPPDPPETWWQ